MPDAPTDALPTSEEWHAAAIALVKLMNETFGALTWTPVAIEFGNAHLRCMRAQHAATVAALASGGDAAIRDAVKWAVVTGVDFMMHCATEAAMGEAEERLLAAIEAQRAAEAARVAADATQRYVEWVCHYRNLAIVLGAKPEQMVSSFDRDLCRRGLTEDEGLLAEVPDVWEQLEAAQAEAARVRDAALEEACKAMCRFCRTGVPFNRDGQHLISDGPGNVFPLNCPVAAIRALREAPRG